MRPNSPLGLYDHVYGVPVISVVKHVSGVMPRGYQRIKRARSAREDSSIYIYIYQTRTQGVSYSDGMETANDMVRSCNLQLMRDKKAWAGELELLAAADKWNLQIVVVRPNESTVIIGKGKNTVWSSLIRASFVRYRFERLTR